MKTATHRHRLSDYRKFHYLVTDRGVFMLIEGEWIKSSVELSDLKPLRSATDKKSCDTTSHKLVAKNCKSKEILVFKSIAEAGGEGFSCNGISKCINHDQKTHKGYEWRWAA